MLGSEMADELPREVGVEDPVGGGRRVAAGRERER